MGVLILMLIAGVSLMAFPIAALTRRRETNIRRPATVALVAGFVLALIALDGLLRTILR